ncbi:unnamed protein product [Paramecium octaurelia]|uniref:Uncharacterized protein n=1 Tax=Paramecium octaurelia TaxID=43137 RepID=A0A8S1SDL3_PAROT|nr:unnamed protein product [Paramecium octaurelia]
MINNENNSQHLKSKPLFSVMKLINNNTFRGQFSEPNQLSSSILQQTNPQLSFPRAERFQSNHAPQLPSPKYLCLTDTKTKRATSFGFGNKQLRPLDLEKRDQLNPAPGTYDIKQTSCRSCSFGMKLQTVRGFDVPGPGSYDLKLLNKTKAFSIYGKINSDIKLPKTASPTSYLPTDKIIQNNRFKQITFGIGDRPLPGLKNESPGPGTYALKSVFEIKSKKKTQQ